MFQTPDGRSLTLDSDAFAAELARSRVFAVEYPLGTFLVIAEHRRRGGRYWVARAYHHGRRASVYVGRSVDEPSLRSAARELTARLTAPAGNGSASDDVVRAVVDDLVKRETDPARRAAARAIAALVMKDAAAHD